MNHAHDPCGHCARFLPDAILRKGEDGQGRCEGFDRPAHSTDQPCVLFVERGSREARLLAKNDRELLQEQQRRHPETISRASAPRGRVTASTT